MHSFADAAIGQTVGTGNAPTPDREVLLPLMATMRCNLFDLPETKASELRGVPTRNETFTLFDALLCV